ncbi:MAG: 2-iminoacetate synthase ThiH [Verrucomicrobiae bacterium]|nr:2-iminoacetate synthase ThiH [Verrucomicrobiae bacterium]
MSFVHELNALPIKELIKRSLDATANDVEQTLKKDKLSLQDFANLISPAAEKYIEKLAQRAHAITLQRFGKVIRLFAPIYLSNECINNCKYCGFSRDNDILRVTLTLNEVMQEARELKKQGFRNILLVAGEHPKFVSVEYLVECVRSVHEEVPSVSLEVGTLKTEDYRKLVNAGAEGLVLYQETYNKELYADLHISGPKRNFEFRLETPERAYAAGFRRLGIGALYGLGDWRYEALSVAAHADYLLKHCWKSYVTVSVPRLRPCAGAFQPPVHMKDKELVQLICAYRIMLPDVGLVLSTREPAWLRDGLIPLGITLMSAGSHTEPGGYTGVGKDKVHKTKGALIFDEANTSGNPEYQFLIADNRSPAQVAEKIRSLGYEPVWKDWDAALCA